MSLQVRLIHALGERLVDLAPRSAEQALVVGRSPDADVQVPSVNVSRRHCLVFIHQDQWVLQDAKGGRGTFVNGKQVKNAVVLKAGDVVTLGSAPNPPQLEIDPYGAGMSTAASAPAQVSEVAEPAAPRPAREARPEPARSSIPPAPRAGASRHAALMPPLPQPRSSPIPPQPQVWPAAPSQPQTAAAQYAPSAYPTPGMPYGAEADAYPAHEEQPAIVEDEPAYEPDPGAEGGLDLLAGDFAVSPSEGLDGAAIKKKSAYYVPRQKGMSGSMIGITIGLTVVIIAGAVWLFDYRRRTIKPEVIVIPGPAPAAVADTKPHTSSVFVGIPVNDPPKAGDAVKTAPPKARVRNPDAGETKPDGAPPEPVQNVNAAARMRDPDFQSIEETHSASSDQPAIQVARYAAFLDEHPDTPFAADVKAYTEEALDLLWWKSINRVMQQRDDMRAAIAKNNTAIASEGAGDYKKKLQADKTEMERKLSDYDKRLEAMNYLSNEHPNLLDPDQLTLLRRARDVPSYTTWKEVEYRKIKRTRGGEW